MPTLQLKTSQSQNPTRYPDLAHELSAITVNTLGERPEVTAVMIEEVKRFLLAENLIRKDFKVADWTVAGAV